MSVNHAGKRSWCRSDLSAGESQEYVEDCPVCCSPNAIHIEMEDEDDIRVWASRGVDNASRGQMRTSDPCHGVSFLLTLPTGSLRLSLVGGIQIEAIQIHDLVPDCHGSR